LSYSVNYDKCRSSLDHVLPTADGGHGLTGVGNSVTFFSNDVQGYQFVARRVDSFFSEHWRLAVFHSGVEPSVQYVSSSWVYILICVLGRK
jgi:hypothetical protein